MGIKQCTKCGVFHDDDICPKCGGITNERWLATTVESLSKDIEALESQKDGAYQERDRLVAALSKLFPAHLARHPDEDESWDDDWRWIVCIHLPTGQATWHIHDSELPWFHHLETKPGHWDGHTTEEKYARLEAIKPGDSTRKE